MPFSDTFKKSKFLCLCLSPATLKTTKHFQNNSIFSSALMSFRLSCVNRFSLFDEPTNIPNRFSTRVKEIPFSDLVWLKTLSHKNPVASKLR